MVITVADTMCEIMLKKGVGKLWQRFFLPFRLHAITEHKRPFSESAPGYLIWT
jgi:hypothetical protein